MWPIVRRINDLEPKLAGLSDASLQEKTFEFKNRLANGETLDDILPEAFAVVREASRKKQKTTGQATGRKKKTKLQGI